METATVRGTGDGASTAEITELPAPEAAPARNRLLRWLPALVTVVVTVILLLTHGTAPLDVARYGLYLLVGLVLPGTLVYRALRRVPHSLVDDLVMGMATGFALELLAWTAYAGAGVQRYLWTWPVLVVALFLAVPGLRKHWRKPEGYRQAPLGWSWAVAAIALVLITYLGVTLLNATAIPSTEPHWYYLDSTYLLSLVTDAMHHFPIGSPQVAGEPLHYHWFTFAHMASASLFSGVEAPIVYFWLSLPMICGVSVVLMAVVGWRVTGRPWVGVLASALMFVVAEFTSTDYVMFGMVGRWMIANSPSMSYAWIPTFALVMIGVDRIRAGGLPDAPLGRGGWALLALFALFASGAKSTILFIVLAAFGMTGLIDLLRRRFPWNAAIASALVLVVIGVSVVVLYGGEANGMRLEPLQLLNFYIPDVPRSAAIEVAVLGFMGGAYVIYMLVRLAGIPVLAWLAWRKKDGQAGLAWSSTEWYLFGAIAAGIGGTLLLWHVSSAQVYLLRSAWPFGAILSALGLAALVDRYQLAKTRVAQILVATGVVATAIMVLLHLSKLDVPGKNTRFVLPVYWALAAALVAAAVIVLAVILARRTGRGTRGFAAVSVLALFLVMGVPVTIREIYHYATSPYTESSYYAEQVGPDAIAAADWIEANTTPDEVLASNAHCPAGAAQTNCLFLTSWLSAYSQRRVVVGGWGYLPRSVVQASAISAWIGTVPFFDQHKLDVNEAAFYEPTADGLAELRDRYDANWLVVDRSVKPESPELRGLATLRFERGDFAVYELR